MNNSAEHRERLLQYRLNELGEQRREEMDTLLISDPDFFAAMQEAEYDLLDAHASGELSEQQRVRVERALLPAGMSSQAAPGLVTGRASASTATQSLPPRSMVRRVRYWAMAACFLIAAGLVFSWQFRARRAEVKVAMQVQPAIPTQALGVVPSRPAVEAKARVKPATQSLAVVLLTSTLRSQNSIALPLNSSAKVVRFVWSNSAEPSTGTGYELEVVTVTGLETCRSHGVAATGRSTFRFDCLAASMQSGTNFVRIFGSHSEADGTPLLESALSVQRR